MPIIPIRSSVPSPSRRVPVAPLWRVSAWRRECPANPEPRHRPTTRRCRLPRARIQLPAPPPPPLELLLPRTPSHPSYIPPDMHHKTPPSTGPTVTASSGRADDGPPDLRILHYNDVYHVDPSSAEPVGGIGRFMTVVKEYRDGARFEGQPELIPLFSGDSFNPSVESTVTKGADPGPGCCVGVRSANGCTCRVTHGARPQRDWNPMRCSRSASSSPSPSLSTPQKLTSPRTTTSTSASTNSPASPRNATSPGSSLTSSIRPSAPTDPSATPARPT